MNSYQMLNTSHDTVVKVPLRLVNLLIRCNLFTFLFIWISLLSKTFVSQRASNFIYFEPTLLGGMFVKAQPTRLVFISRPFSIDFLKTERLYKMVKFDVVLFLHAFLNHSNRNFRVPIFVDWVLYYYSVSCLVNVKFA